MSLNRSSLSARSLIEQVFSSVGLVALCSSISCEATGYFGYGYSPLNLLDSISFLVEACAKVNELFNLFQGGSIVDYIDGRCVSADDPDLSLLGVQ